ncbi:MAG: ABC transporter ATP-binding protein [Patescibacteria group bacterium]|nr:ABC transporter ATP-binding protein [Patescibacteria group bacterium]
MIKAKNISKKYKIGKNNFVEALKGVSVEIKKGEMVAIMGPSGSGKSTLMHILGCLDRPDEGEVYIDGKRVDNLKNKEINEIRSKRLGFIFQGFNLIPTLLAIENVSLAAEYAGAPKMKSKKLSEKVLEKVGLKDRMRHKPSELSGGQQQRVAIARSLINSPVVILGDEPTGDLDTVSSDEIIQMMRQINKETGTTFVLVTHNPEVAKVCDRTINMRDGKIVS